MLERQGRQGKLERMEKVYWFSSMDTFIEEVVAILILDTENLRCEWHDISLQFLLHHRMNCIDCVGCND